MAFSTIDVSTPAGSDKKKFGDDKIREFKTQVDTALKEICGYPNNVAMRTAVWTTNTRPTTNLVDRLSGVNTTTGFAEYYDATAAAWVVPVVTPVGGIIMWPYAVADIPSGWALCDGKTYGGVVTPNMVGMFPYGVNGDDYPLLGTGGKINHTITAAEIPKHQHNFLYYSQNRLGVSSNVNAEGWSDGNNVLRANPTEFAGGDEDGNTTPHNNMPPYRCLHFIMRIS